MEPNQEITNCPLCGRHCLIDAPSCERGQALSAKLKSGEQIDLEAICEKHSKRRNHERGRHRHGNH